MIVAIAFVFVRILKLLMRLKRAIETELATRRAITELNEMSDHMLRDLGIARGEIEHVLRRPGVRVGRDDSLSIPDEATASIRPRFVATAHRRDARRVQSFPSRVA